MSSLYAHLIRVRVVAGMVWLETVRRKDAYVLLILLATLLGMLATRKVFGIGGVSRYVVDAGLLMTWILSWGLGIAVTARQLPDEESKGTIMPLLAKPLSRAELVVGKWLGAWTVTAAATAAFCVLVALVAWLRGGPVDLVALAQGWLAHCGGLSVVCSMALWCSVRLHQDAAVTLGWVLTAGATLVVPRIPAILVDASPLRSYVLQLCYHLLPHLEVFDMRRRIVHGYGPASWGSLGLVLLYGSVVTLFFLVWSWLLYRRKRFSRGALV